VQIFPAEDVTDPTGVVTTASQPLPNIHDSDR
jgi:hypothetical protein